MLSNLFSVFNSCILYFDQNLEICRLYELDNISVNVLKVLLALISYLFMLLKKVIKYPIINFFHVWKTAGMYNWKHGRRGFGIYWLQLARDEVRLNRIAQQLFKCIGKSLSDDSFKVLFCFP